MAKPKHILELEKHYGIKLWKAESWEPLHFKHYITNEKEDIIGLNLNFNQIKDISVLSKLKQLKTLVIGSNQVRDISVLSKLKQLKTLVIGSNQVRDISALSKLRQLEYLCIRHSKLNDISVLSRLTQLKTIDISYNQISEFPLRIIRPLKKLTNLYLYENPIQNIPQEIFNKRNCLEGVLNYLEDLEKGKSQNRMLKLIFIGNGSVGKTQIAKRLAEQAHFVFNSQHDSTHAIVRLKRAFGAVELQLWDFAGQDVYHATHRLFMQTRALFVLVWDFDNQQKPFHTWEGKRYKNEKLLYWLEYARCFGQGSPLLVLQNKVDSPEDALKCLLQQAQKQHQSNYPILDFLQVSAKTGSGFDLLETVLEEHLEENETLQAFLKQELPNSWIAVRSAIEELQSDGHKTMEWTDFQNLCKKHEVEKSTSTILNYLHDTGVLYHRSHYFGGKIILNQSWVIEAVYKILDRQGEIASILRHRKGKLKHRQLCKIWKDHSDEERTLFMEFMLSTELCFETNDWNKKEIIRSPTLKERSFVVPVFLAKEKPWEVDFRAKKMAGENKYERIRPYRFLPTVFMQRFIVAANRLSDLDLMWQQGILLQTTEGVAIVEANYSDQTIAIQATSERLLQRIEEELDEIANEGKVHAQALKEGKNDPLMENEQFMREVGLKGLKAQNSEPVSAFDREALKHLPVIQTYIEEGKLEKALKTTADWMLKSGDLELEKQIRLLQYRYRSNELARREGTLTDDEYTAKQNKVTKALLGFLGELDI